MGDWATEIAQDILRSGAGHLSQNAATALRRAKADGMREAARLMDEELDGDETYLWAVQLRQRAQKLEISIE